MNSILRKSLLAVIIFSLGFTGCDKVKFKVVVESEGYTIGLSMYSLREMFKSGELHALDYPAFVKETFGITKVDVWYGGFPKEEVDNPEFYKKLKSRADAEGVEIFLLMAGAVDVRNSEPADLKAQAEKFFVDVDRAVMLGSSFVRVFVKAPTGGDRAAALQNAVTAIQVLADYAQSKGIILAIEPGASDWTKDGTFLADIARTVDHPSCKLMPDFGKMLDVDPYEGTIAMMPYAVVVSAKTHDIYENGELEHFDYPRLMKSVTDAGFTDIVAIEYEGKNLGPVEGVKATQKILQDLNK